MCWMPRLEWAFRKDLFILSSVIFREAVRLSLFGFSLNLEEGFMVESLQHEFESWAL